MYKKIKLLEQDIVLRFEKTKEVFDNVSVIKYQTYYVLKRTVKNLSGRILNLSGLKAELSGNFFGKNTTSDYYYCNENARLFGNLTIPLDYNRYNDNSERNDRFNLPVDRKYCDPEVVEGRICSCPYQPFPAILLSNYKSNKGIVVGSLSQDVFYHSFETGHKDGKAYLEIYSSFKDIAYREIKPDEKLTDIIGAAVDY